MNGLCRITYDWNGPPDERPGIGCYLKASKSQRAYLIVGARQVNSHVHSCRLAFQCERTPAATLPADAIVYAIHWYKR